MCSSPTPRHLSCVHVFGFTSLGLFAANAAMHVRMVAVLKGLLTPVKGHVDEETLEMLAMDVKATLSGLRKLRRQWLYLNRGSASANTWPSVAYAYPVLLSMLDLISTGDRPQDESVEVAEDQREPAGEGILFDVKITQEDEALHTLKKRRMEALEAMQDAVVELDSDVEQDSYVADTSWVIHVLVCRTRRAHPRTFPRWPGRSRLC